MYQQNFKIHKTVEYINLQSWFEVLTLLPQLLDRISEREPKSTINELYVVTYLEYCTQQLQLLLSTLDTFNKIELKMGHEASINKFQRTEFA